MYNQLLINFYIKETNNILDLVELAEETKSVYAFMRAVSDAGYVQALIADKRICGSKHDYSEKFIDDLESFENFLVRLKYEMTDLITVK